MKKKVIDFDLLCNMSSSSAKVNNKQTETTVVATSRDDAYLKADDNAEILHLLHQRLKLGFSRYGHGLRVDDDTRKYGTKTNDFIEMGLEEILDNLVYMATATVRHMRSKRLGYNNREIHDDCIVDDYRKRYLRFTRN